MRSSKPVKVEIYSKADCHLCDIAKAVILKVKNDLAFELEVHDIEANPKWFEEFKEQIPVVFINNQKAFKYHVEERILRDKIARLS